MFKEYQSKPITRLAHKINDTDGLVYLPENSEASITVDGSALTFKCYEEPAIGDYVCYLNDEDIYHCNAKVFAERNIIGD